MDTLKEIVRNKLLPWSEDARGRIIVGCKEIQVSSLPSGVHLEKRQLKGKRKVVRDERSYRNIRSVIARWPFYGMNETNLLKLACVISGACSYQLGNHTLFCEPGCFIVIPPRMPHPDGTRCIADAGKSTFCEILNFLLYPDALRCWIDRYETDSKPQSAVRNFLFQNERLAGQFKIFIQDALLHPERKKIQEKLFQALVHLLYEDIAEGAYMDTVTGKAAWSRYDKLEGKDFVTELHHYIQSHLQERPTLETAAHAMYFSRTQFARKVRHETGKTYGELVNEQRLETAKTLLQNTVWTIETVSKFVGYTSPHYFHIMFRKNMKLTPGEYRKSTKKPAFIKKERYTN